jgi:hypothetical protein
MLEILKKLHIFGRNGPFASTPDPIELYIFSAPLPAVSDNEKNAVAAYPCRTFSHRMQAQTPIKTKRHQPHRLHHGLTDSKMFPVSNTDTSHSQWDIASNTGNTTLRRRSWSPLTCERIRHILIFHHFRTAVPPGERQRGRRKNRGRDEAVRLGGLFCSSRAGLRSNSRISNGSDSQTGALRRRDLTAWLAAEPKKPPPIR